MQQLVECVPNFSEGRDPDIYHAIAAVIRETPGVHLLDISPDEDHNRTVITFVGPPEAVEEAAFQAIREASQRINLDEHEGEHPRIGATDVVPFVPVRGVTMADCVAIARRLGRRVGEELGIAVYLYAEAATRPEREKLSAIRRGQYERWKEEIGQNPERDPDFGPAEPKPWGATAIGARPFLIAYNIYLNSDNVDIADQIARNVRFSSGGLRYIQAKGFLVEGQAQVSMNLTNFEKTPIHQVTELVRREAAAYGLTISQAELIGMAPQAAFMTAARWYLQLHDLRDEQILEFQLQAQQTSPSDISDGQAEAASSLIPESFLQATAEASATPGGGSTAALAGALGAALTRMVAGLTAGRKKYADVSAEAQEIDDLAMNLQRQLAAAIDEDAAAFDAVMAAMRAKEISAEDRASAIEAATIGAGEVPLRVARLSRQVAELAARIARIGNQNAVTDAAAGAIMARAAVEVAALNVKTNAVSLQDRALAASWVEEVDRLITETRAIAGESVSVAAERGGF